MLQDNKIQNIVTSLGESFDIFCLDISAKSATQKKTKKQWSWKKGFPFLSVCKGKF